MSNALYAGYQPAPHGCARQTAWAFSGIMIASGSPINNRPQVDNLPHMAARRELGIGEIVAAREDFSRLAATGETPVSAVRARNHERYPNP